MLDRLRQKNIEVTPPKLSFDFGDKKSFLDFVRFQRFLRAIKTIANTDVLEKLDGVSLTTLEEVFSGFNLKKIERTIAFLVSFGVFKVVDHSLILTTFGKSFVESKDGSAKKILDFVLSQEVCNAYDCLGDSLSTDTPAFELANQRPVFDPLRPPSEFDAKFQKAMHGASAVLDKEAASLLASHIKQECDSVLDLGGGNGSFLVKLKKALPNTAMLNADLVIKDPLPGIEHIRLNFFTDEIPKADFVVLKKVLHDWSNEEAQQILKNTLEQSNPTQIFVIDTVKKAESDNNLNELSKVLMDMEMLIMHGVGQERSLSEWKDVYSEAGLVITKNIPVSGIYQLMILERR